MASRLLLKRAAGFGSRMAYQPLLRFQSTARPEPAAVASSLIDLFPGNSVAAKSSSVLVAASVAAWLISKEIYILDAEFFEMLCIFGAYGLVYSSGKDAAVAYLDGKRNTIKSVLEQGRADHKTVVQERINHIGKMSNVVEVTKDLYEMSKEIAKLEAEAYELKQKVAFTNEVKNTLDSWVRHEANVREQEQKRLVAHVIEQVKSKLTDPKLQQTILNQSIADVEKLTAQ
ncbi:hypothetical protein EDD86DRAFT_196895 [Gorgonomyces haynaldii]|nr:hypothetical protein EDD86DRAFT_196895 [Gorgonomyces haynaldii]